MTPEQVKRGAALVSFLEEVADIENCNPDRFEELEISAMHDVSDSGGSSSHYLSVPADIGREFIALLKTHAAVELAKLGIEVPA